MQDFRLCHSALHACSLWIAGVEQTDFMSNCHFSFHPHTLTYARTTKKENVFLLLFLRTMKYEMIAQQNSNMKKLLTARAACTSIFVMGQRVSSCTPNVRAFPFMTHHFESFQSARATTMHNSSFSQGHQFSLFLFFIIIYFRYGSLPMLIWILCKEELRFLWIILCRCECIILTLWESFHL